MDGDGHHHSLKKSPQNAIVQDMPKRSSKGKKDIAELAHSIVQRATEGEPDTVEDLGGKNPAAVALGRLGGKKGGKARAKSLTAKQRSEIARKAADARWKVPKE